jgi:hypothetical protein
MSILNVNSFLVFRRLQVASCCAAGKGVDYMKLLQKGTDCPEILEDTDKITALVNAMLCYARIYINANSLITSTVASNTPTTTSISVAGVTIATATYTTASTTVVATTLAAAVNSGTTTFGYTAAPSQTANSFVLASRDGSASNNAVVVITTSAGTFTNNGSLMNGRDYLSDNAGVTCISLAQINGILDKLSQLCGCSCKQYVTYEKPN